MERLGTEPADLARAAELLRAGRLVAFPTETVYGLGADATNPDAVAAIFAAKGRPADHPVIVHLGSAQDLEQWADPVPEAARRLADAFWPGPLTLVLRRAAGVSDLVTGGQDSVGVRVPNHPVARALLRAFGGALAAPSANRFGHISPTTAQHVIDEFGDEVAAVIDGGACPVGVESTIVDLSGNSSSNQPRLLRPGMIRPEAIVQALGAPLAHPDDEEGPRASGRLASHYAPNAPLELVDAADLERRLDRCARDGERVVVLARSPQPAGLHKVAWGPMPGQPVQYARRLYAELRAADRLAPDRILVESPPDASAWDAIRDRLQRAATAAG
jgi:L-threonylcarbamoyladenylate synthase